MHPTPLDTLVIADQVVPGAPVVVAPRNRSAARRALRVWATVVACSLFYRLMGGDSSWPLVVAAALTPILWPALEAARQVELDGGGVTVRGLLRTRRIPWEAVRAITWWRDGGVESFRLRGRFASAHVSSECEGFAAAARRIERVAAFRGIRIDSAT